MIQRDHTALINAEFIDENLQVVTYIMSLIYLDESLKPLKDGQEIILFFTMQAVNAITDLETYLSVLATIVTFLPAITEENTAATLLARTIEQLFKTILKHDCC
jgi:hypothetical protein